MKRLIISAGCMAVALSVVTVAQETPDRPRREGPPEGRPGRFVMPLMGALDANSDGTIDATEISNASAALKKLDKNSDGKLTPEELRPARPDGARPPGERRGRPNRPPSDE